MGNRKESSGVTKVGYSWGILLGMAGLPIVALMRKVFPSHERAWMILLVLCGLVVAGSVVGYLILNFLDGCATTDRAADLIAD